MKMHYLGQITTTMHAHVQIHLHVRAHVRLEQFLMFVNADFVSHKEEISAIRS